MAFQPVYAGTWTPHKGRGVVIISAAISQTPLDDRASTTDLYYERGLGGGWTFVLTPSVSDQAKVVARNEAQVSLRKALYGKNGWAVSVQGGAYVWHEGADRSVSSGTEARLGIGKSIGQGGWANVEAALRQCQSQNSVRWEATLGQTVRRVDRAIIKVFGDSEGCTGNISRTQISYVYGLNDRLGLELGWRETLPNDLNWDERGAIIGIWIAF
jgi:hypothetical protein